MATDPHSGLGLNSRTRMIPEDLDKMLQIRPLVIQKELCFYPNNKIVLVKDVDAPEGSKLNVISIHNCCSTPFTHSCIKNKLNCKVQPRLGANM